MTEHADADGRPASRTEGRGTTTVSRLALLDLIRGIALLRVILFHISGIDGLTLVASMPLMFFVAGALYARSMQSRSGLVVIRDRFRRILPSLAVYASVLVAGYGAAGLLTSSWGDVLAPDGSIARLGVYHSLGLYLPVVSGVPPVGPGTPTDPVFWTWNPLWYLHTHLMLALFGVVLVFLYRRWPRATLIGASLWWLLVTIGARGVGNTPTFALMFLIGFTFTDGRLFALSRRVLVWATVVAFAVGLAFLPLGGGWDVNQWAPSLLGAGLGWVCVALAWRESLERAALGPVLRPLVHFLSRRALTIYLWHLAGVYVARLVLEPTGRLGVDLLIGVASLGITAAVTLVACLAFGWVEDLAARRSPEFLLPGLVGGATTR